MIKQPKLTDVQNLRPLNKEKDGSFLLVYRQAVSLALKEEIRRETGRKTGTQP